MEMKLQNLNLQICDEMYTQIFKLATSKTGSMACPKSHRLLYNSSSTNMGIIIIFQHVLYFGLALY
jgi:hypothetical protein